MILYGIILFLIGCYQILSTLISFFWIRRLSNRSRTHLNYYIGLVVVFFFMCMILDLYTTDEDYLLYWLFFGPVPIAVYRLVFGLRMWKEIRTPG